MEEKQNVTTNETKPAVQEQKSQNNNVDTDKIGKFVSKHFSNALKTFQNSKLMPALLIAGLVSFGINLLPVLGLMSLVLLPILLPLTIVLSIIFSFSLMNIALKATKGEVPTIKTATEPLPKIIPLLIGGLQVLIESIVKLFQPPFILPGIKNAIGSSFFVPLHLETPKGVSESVKHSKEVTKGNLLNLFALGFCVAILNFVGGIIPFGIGLIFTSPFGYLVMVDAYREITKTK